jgi:hypothetical protein
MKTVIFFVGVLSAASLYAAPYEPVQPSSLNFGEILKNIATPTYPTYLGFPTSIHGAEQNEDNSPFIKDNCKNAICFNKNDQMMSKTDDDQKDEDSCKNKAAGCRTQYTPVKDYLDAEKETYKEIYNSEKQRHPDKQEKENGQ